MCAAHDKKPETVKEGSSNRSEIAPFPVNGQGFNVFAHSMCAPRVPHGYVQNEQFAEPRAYIIADDAILARPLNHIAASSELHAKAPVRRRRARTVPAARRMAAEPPEEADTKKRPGRERSAKKRAAEALFAQVKEEEMAASSEEGLKEQDDEKDEDVVISRESDAGSEEEKDEEENIDESSRKTTRRRTKGVAFSVAEASSHKRPGRKRASDATKITENGEDSRNVAEDARGRKRSKTSALRSLPKETSRKPSTRGSAARSSDEGDKSKQVKASGSLIARGGKDQQMATGVTTRSRRNIKAAEKSTVARDSDSDFE